MNVGLLSTLTGIRSGPDTSASAPEQVGDSAPFLSALMEAFGLTTAVDDGSLGSSPDSDAAPDGLASLLSMLSTARDGNVEHVGDGSETPGAVPSRDSLDSFGPPAGASGSLEVVGWGTTAPVVPLSPSVGTGNASEAPPPVTHDVDAVVADVRSSEPLERTARSQHGLGAIESPGSFSSSASTEKADQPNRLARGASALFATGSPTVDATPNDTMAHDGSRTVGVVSDEGGAPVDLSSKDASAVSTAPETMSAAHAASAAADLGDPSGITRPGGSAEFGSDESVVALSAATVADPSLDKVAPALRQRIERVIDRMRDEFGHEVSVIEGYRSPERQAHLYAQGRTRPGEIATWTQRSWHSEGLAADLMVDGGYDDRLAYARLQRIALEEGLKTLGSRDMGHVELPRTGLPGGESAPFPGPGRRFVGVATPAEVAAPAAPAGVARVAMVATPGQWVTQIPAEPASVEVPVEVEVEAALDDSSSNVSREATRRTEPSMRSDFASQLAEARVSTGASSRAGGAVEGAGEASAAEQAARVAELRAMAEAVQPSRVSVRLDGPGGDQLRVGLLNRSIDAALDISDPERAKAMRTGVAELHQALEARGLELGALSVNGAAGTAGPGGWLGGATDPASEIIRTLLAGGAAEGGSDGRGGERPSADQRTNNRGGSGSDRPSRDAHKERDQ